jgi:hypothetical protein
MNGIGRSAVWFLLSLVGACDADSASSPNGSEAPVSDGPASDATVFESSANETSGHTVGPTSEGSSGADHETTSPEASGTPGDDLADAGQTPAGSTSASTNSSTGPAVVGVRALGARCERADRLGGLSVNLTSDRTIIAGAVSNGVLPSSVPEVAAEAGACQLLVPRNLFCSSCDTSQACAGDDQCVPKPSKVSAGTLRVDGLLAKAEVEPNGITLDYSKTIIDPFPAYAAGDALTFNAEGDVVAAFEADLIGVPALSSSMSAVAVEHGESAALSWDAEGADPTETAVFVSFSVNVHGGVTGWIECIAPDTGEFEIPAELVSQLIDLGSSGFPRVEMERRSSATVELESGCIELYVGSKVTLDIELDGLTSCHDDDDCVEDQSCNEELACE